MIRIGRPLPRKLLLWNVILLGSLSACNEGTRESQAVEPPAADEAPIAEGTIEAPAEEDIAPEAVPLAEDFEAEVAGEISEDNLEAKLAELESAMEAELP